MSNQIRINQSHHHNVHKISHLLMYNMSEVDDFAKRFDVILMWLVQNEGCWLNQHFLKVQPTKMVQPLGYVGSNGGVGWTSIWRWLSQHFLKVQPTKMVQPSGNVGSKCWCWFNQHLKIVEPAFSEGSTNTSILNQQNLMVEPS